MRYRWRCASVQGGRYTSQLRMNNHSPSPMRYWVIEWSVAEKTFQAQNFWESAGDQLELEVVGNLKSFEDTQCRCYKQLPFQKEVRTNIQARLAEPFSISLLIFFYYLLSSTLLLGVCLESHCWQTKTALALLLRQSSTFIGTMADHYMSSFLQGYGEVYFLNLNEVQVTLPCP